MTDLQLKYFIVSAQLLNFTTAAERLYMTQPALSRQIASLENELGVKLFRRQNNVLELTAIGSFFYTRILGVYEDLEQIAKEVRALGAGIEGRLRIGLMEDQRLLPQVVSAIHSLVQEHPKLDIQISRYNYSDLIEKLDNDGIDIFQALLYKGLAPGVYQSVSLSKEPMYLAYNPRFFHIDRQYIVDDHDVSTVLGDYPIYLVAASTYPQSIRSNLASIQIRSARYVESVLSIPLYITTGIAATIVNQNNVIAANRDFQFIPLGVPKVTQGMVWLRRASNPILISLVSRLEETDKLDAW